MAQRRKGKRGEKKVKKKEKKRRKIERTISEKITCYVIVFPCVRIAAATDGSQKEGKKEKRWKERKG